MITKQKYDIYSKDFRRQSHAVFARMRAEDPVVQQPGLDGQTPIWFVTRYQEIEQVLLDDRRFVRDPALVYSPEEIERSFGTSDPRVDAMMNTHMLNRDGEDHRQLRSLVSKAFTPKVIQNMQPRIEAIATGLLDRVAERGQMELVSEYAFPLPITVIAELLGIPLDNQDQFRIWSNAFVRPAITTQEQQESLVLLQQFAIYMLNLVNERRQHPASTPLPPDPGRGAG
jgi:cytochrome P450